MENSNKIRNIDVFDKLKSLKLSHPTNITCGYLNINAIAKKLDGLTSMLDSSIDILCIGETKLDDSYPDAQFHVPGYNLPYREDGKSVHSGGLMIYVNESIPSKKLSKTSSCDGIEVIPVELNLKKAKWLILAIYRPDWVEKNKFLDSISTLLRHNFDTTKVIN